MISLPVKKEEGKDDEKIKADKKPKTSKTSASLTVMAPVTVGVKLKETS